MKKIKNKKVKSGFLKVLFVTILITSYIYLCSAISVPNSIVLFEGEKLNLKVATGLSLVKNNKKEEETVLTTSSINKEKINNVRNNRFGFKHLWQH